MWSMLTNRSFTRIVAIGADIFYLAFRNASVKALSGTLSPTSPAVAQRADGTQTEQREAGRFGHDTDIGCYWTP